MIVLAIAGLILAVVFIAVPALNRNQRNSARTADRNNIRQAVLQVQANTGGRTAADHTVVGGALTGLEVAHVGDGNGSYNNSIEVANVKAFTVAAPQIDDGEIEYIRRTSTVTTHTTTGTPGDFHYNGLVIIGDARCAKDIISSDGKFPTAGANIGGGIQGAANRGDIVVLYRIEGDNNIYCDDNV